MHQSDHGRIRGVWPAAILRLIVSLALVLALVPVFGQSPAGGIGGRIRLEAPGASVIGGKMQVLGRGTVGFDGMVVSADNITMDSETGLLVMVGNLVFDEGDRHFTATRAEYRLSSRSGRIKGIQGEVRGRPIPSFIGGESEGLASMSRGYCISAEEAEISTNVFARPKLLLKGVGITDCDHIPPHHDLRASSATYSSAEKLELWNLRPRIGRVPYFYFPYAIRDLQYPWPWTRWEFGAQTDWGRYFFFNTHAFPTLLQRRSQIGIDYREFRGWSFRQDFQSTTAGSESRIGPHLFDERWESEHDEGSAIQQLRTRLDFFHRRELNADWKMTLEYHYLSPTKTYYWTNGSQSLLSENRFSIPPGLPGIFQERKGLLEEYYKEEFRTGRALERTLALDYARGRYFAHTTFAMPQDEEAITTNLKSFETTMRGLPQPLKKNSRLLHSFDLETGRMGSHYGRKLSPDDRLLLFGTSDVNDFSSWRVYAENKLELPLAWEPYFRLNPF
ncbi:MAG: hypothetical protein HQL31_06350, partial [Planctomycetes bacterium]|nr:hypothetical protein [Planctomycetota bacterium]